VYAFVVYCSNIRRIASHTPVPKTSQSKHEKEPPRCQITCSVFVVTRPEGQRRYIVVTPLYEAEPCSNKTSAGGRVGQPGRVIYWSQIPLVGSMADRRPYVHFIVPHPAVSMATSSVAGSYSTGK